MRIHIPILLLRKWHLATNPNKGQDWHLVQIMTNLNIVQFSAFAGKSCIIQLALTCLMLIRKKSSLVARNLDRVVVV